MPLDVARRGTLDVRDPPLRAIVAANDDYEAGYHKGNAGGLDAIDTDLATANIKNGITIFGKVGSADVHDISDATAVEAEVITGETFYAVGGGIRTGTMPIVALAPGSSAYPAGYHAGDGGGLPAIDADLATANIKNGITIFNIPGDVDVRDVSDANALVGEVMNGRTFYAVGGAIKTGTMPTVAIAAGSSAYPTGYHAGHGGGLPAIDADLATGNIKFGITIFNIAGHTNVRDSSDANLTAPEAPTGKTFYAGGGARKTGSGTKTLNPANETVAAGYYAGTTLSAVDGDLAVGNIKQGVTIFGFLGTLAPGALAEDVKGSAQCALNTNTSEGFFEHDALAVGAGGNSTVVTFNQTYDAASMAFGVGFTACMTVDEDEALKLQLVMGGVQVAESGYIPKSPTKAFFILIGTRALSGSQDCLLRVHNYDASGRVLLVFGCLSGQPADAHIAVGSVKLA